MSQSPGRRRSARLGRAGIGNKTARPSGRAVSGQARSGSPHPCRWRRLVAFPLPDLVGCAACPSVEVERGVEGAAMEEVLLRILSGDEAEAAIGDDLLDGTGGHDDLHIPNGGC